MNKLTLIGFKLCPYVQRTIITMIEKQISHEIEYIDLHNKPTWFKQVSPFGRVPMLIVGETQLFESSIINEYLDEISAPHLHAEDPLERAQQRAWIEFISACLVYTYKLMVADTQESAMATVKVIRTKLARLEKQLNHKRYFSGDTFSLVDAAAAPLMLRLTWCEAIRYFDFFEPYPKVAAWRDSLLTRPSVGQSLVPDAIELFREYLRGKRSASFQTEPSWLGSLVKPTNKTKGLSPPKLPAEILGTLHV